MIFTIEQFEKSIQQLPLLKIETEEKHYIITSEAADEMNFTIEKEEISNLLNLLKKDKSSVPSQIVASSYYESVIREESHGPLLMSRRLGSEGFVILDKDNDLTYRLSFASKLFIIKFLLSNEFDFKKFIIRHRMRNRFNDKEDFWMFLGKVFFLFTLRIEAESNIKSEQFRSLAKAFLFNLNYNLGVVYVEAEVENDSDRFFRLRRYRRSKLEDIDPPRRIYQNELVDHFLMAQSSPNVTAVFLSYYHIMEFYFIQVFEENLVKQVKQKITSSAFSYKKDKEIRGLIKFISKQMKIQEDDRYAFSELEALSLVLKKMVNLNLVRDELNQYDPNLIEYYKTTGIFSKATLVFDLNDLENSRDKVIKALAQRIYGLRNAIVHNKDGGGDTYTPFKDDKKLLQEIPLLRFIAEEIINYNSDILE